MTARQQATAQPLGAISAIIGNWESHSKLVPSVPGEPIPLELARLCGESDAQGTFIATKFESLTLFWLGEKRDKVSIRNRLRVLIG